MLGGWRGLDKGALEGCLGVVALALGVVMAGTGHLPTLKLLRGKLLTLHPLSTLSSWQQSPAEFITEVCCMCVLSALNICNVLMLSDGFHHPQVTTPSTGLSRRLQGPALVMFMGQTSQHNYSAQ